MKSFFISRALVAICGVGTTLGASLMVSTFAGPDAVHALDWQGPNYAQDVRGFSPVGRGLLKELAAPRAVSHAKPASAAPVSIGPAADQSPGSLPVSEPSPLPGDVTPPPPAPPPAPSPTLSVAMTADASTTHPNDVFTYTIRVTNTGPGDASGLVVESHVPDGTTLAGWTCDGKSVSAAGRGSLSCGGSSSSTGHDVVFGSSTLASGSQVVFTFWVRVDKGLHHNTAITNHAHAYAGNADLVDSEQVTVVV